MASSWEHSKTNNQHNYRRSFRKIIIADDSIEPPLRNRWIERRALYITCVDISMHLIEFNFEFNGCVM